MRVLMYEPTGGFWPYAHDISQAIAELGVEVILLTSEIRAGLNADGLQRYRLEPLARAMNPKLRLKREEPWSAVTWAVDRGKSALQWLMIRSRIVKALKPDIIHIQKTIPLFDRFFLPRFSKKHRLIITVHDVLPIATTRAIGSKQALQGVYNSADHLIVHSPRCKEELITIFGLNPDIISVIPHGVWPAKIIPKDESRTVLGLPSEAEIVLFFGAIRRSKGLDLAIKALSLAVKIRKNLFMVVAGSLSPEVDIEEYKKIANEVNVEDRIKWQIGYIPETQVPYYFCSADLVILPYTLFYSQSGVLLQAYRYGIPVVVSDKGALGETVRSDITGIVVESLTPVAFAEAMVRLLGDLPMQLEFRRNELTKVHGDYHWKTVAKRTIAVYEYVLGKLHNE
ncbi:MAG TPA: glycosyltransferase family 4 protein [Syntrophothermus lipocalidus]|nr:glycosyltransferase family 4 protein [Syntrophothermus lipocalidus]